jgi:hypothetical protein
MNRIFAVAIAVAAAAAPLAAHAQTPRTWWIINTTAKRCDPMASIGQGQFPNPLTFMNGMRVNGTVSDLSSDGTGSNQIVVFSATNRAFSTNGKLTFTMLADYNRCNILLRHMAEAGQLLSDDDLK